MIHAPPERKPAKPSQRAAPVGKWRAAGVEPGPAGRRPPACAPVPRHRFDIGQLKLVAEPLHGGPGQRRAAAPRAPIAGAASGTTQLKKHKQRIFSNKNKMSLGEFHQWAARDQARQQALASHEQANPRFLDTLKTEDDTTHWANRDPDLAASHHKFPKSALVWLHRHSAPEDQEATRKALHLSSDSGAMAMTRLHSNLISPKFGNLRVTSDKRVDDPHNNQQASKRGEEGLDLVHQTDGQLSPRSRQYSDLRKLVLPIHARLTEAVSKGSDLQQKGKLKKGFKLTTQEAQAVRSKLVTAEKLHYAIEDKPLLPSHASGDVWQQDAPSAAPKYNKQPVAPVHVKPAQDYAKKKKAEQRQQQIDRNRREGIEGRNYPHSDSFRWARHSERLA